MVRSVAVSLPQAWAAAWSRSPGSSLGWSSSIWRTSRNVDLHCAKAGGKQHGCRFDGLCTCCSPEKFELRHVAQQAIDEVQVESGAVRSRQPCQYREAANDDRRLCDENPDVDDTLDDGGHCVAEKRDSATRHGTTAHLASRLAGSHGRGRRPERDRARRTVDGSGATRAGWC